MINDSTNILNAHTGILMLKYDRVIFIPIILKQLIFLYKPHMEKDKFHFSYISHTLPENPIEKHIKSKLSILKTALNV